MILTVKENSILKRGYMINFHNKKKFKLPRDRLTLLQSNVLMWLVTAQTMLCNCIHSVDDNLSTHSMPYRDLPARKQKTKAQTKKTVFQNITVHWQCLYIQEL